MEREGRAVLKISASTCIGFGIVVDQIWTNILSFVAKWNLQKRKFQHFLPELEWVFFREKKKKKILRTAER